MAQGKTRWFFFFAFQSKKKTNTAKNPMTYSTRGRSFILTSFYFFLIKNIEKDRRKKLTKKINKKKDVPLKSATPSGGGGGNKPSKIPKKNHTVNPKKKVKREREREREKQMTNGADPPVGRRIRRRNADAAGSPRFAAAAAAFVFPKKPAQPVRRSTTTTSKTTR